MRKTKTRERTSTEKRKGMMKKTEKEQKRGKLGMGNRGGRT